MIHTKSVNPALGLRALVAGVWFGAGMGRGSAGADYLILQTPYGGQESGAREDCDHDHDDGHQLRYEEYWYDCTVIGACDHVVIGM